MKLPYYWTETHVQVSTESLNHIVVCGKVHVQVCGGGVNNVQSHFLHRMPSQHVTSKKVPDGLCCLQPLFHIHISGGQLNKRGDFSSRFSKARELRRREFPDIVQASAPWQQLKVRMGG